MKKIFLSIALISSLYSNNDLIIDSKKDKIKNSFLLQQNEAEKTTNQIISPLNLNIGINKSKDNFSDNTTNFQELNWNQYIWRSGAIFHSIKYSNKFIDISKNEKNILVDDLVKEIYIIAKKIQIIDLNININKFLLENIYIEYKRKLDLYNNSMIDITFLNNTLNEKLSIKNNLISFKKTKKDLIFSLQKLTKYQYQKIDIPHLKFPKKEVFIEENKYQITKDKIENQQTLNKINESNYLPKASVNLKYTNQEIENIDNDRYYMGITLSMPFHPNYFKEKETSKINLLKLKNEYNDKLYELNIDYDNYKFNYDLLNEKIKNYESIVSNTNDIINANKDLVKNGFKLKEDLDILKNSNSINMLEIKKLEFEKDLIILELVKQIF